MDMMVESTLFEYNIKTMSQVVRVVCNYMAHDVAYVAMSVTCSCLFSATQYVYKSSVVKDIAINFIRYQTISNKLYI